MNVYFIHTWNSPNYEIHNEEIANFLRDISLNVFTEV